MSLPSYVEVINPATKPVPVAGGGTTSTVDVTDRTGRLVGHVTIDSVTGTVTVSGSVSVSNFPATQPVSGSVSVSNFPATQPVSGTFWQATQPVSAAALPLPANAAQETGGNMDSIKTSLNEIALDTDNLVTMSAGIPALSLCSATEPTLVDGKNYASSITPAGRIRVDIEDDPDASWTDTDDDVWDLDQDTFNMEAFS